MRNVFLIPPNYVGDVLAVSGKAEGGQLAMEEKCIFLP